PRFIVRRHFLLNTAASMLLLPVAHMAAQSADGKAKATKQEKPYTCIDGKVTKAHIVIQSYLTDPITPNQINADAVSKDGKIIAEVDMTKFGAFTLAQKSAAAEEVGAATKIEIYDAIYKCAREYNPQVRTVPVPEVRVNFVWDKVPPSTAMPK